MFTVRRIRLGSTMRILLRRPVITQDYLILGFITVVLLASPGFSRPVLETQSSLAPSSESSAAEKATGTEERLDTDVAASSLTSSKLTVPEKTLLSLKEEAANSEDQTAENTKRPTKRSQGFAAGFSEWSKSSNTGIESVSLSPQIPDPDKKGSAVQGFLLNILQPKPIVDTIREEDKYGNTGDKFAAFGRTVVAGAEGVSNVLLKVLDFPFEAVKKVSRNATEALNNLGSKLIGL